MEALIFWTAFSAFLALGIFLAIAIAAVAERFGWEQPWMPREDFDSEHGHRERVGL